MTRPKAGSTRSGWPADSGRLTLALALACGIALQGACASAPPESALDLRGAPIVLLGEVHDNAAQHALRLEAFRALLASGARPALLMEQFDRERQADIDRARALPGANAQALIAAAQTPSSRWNWDFYRPFVALALLHGLPIVAANVSRADARLVMQRGLAAQGFDAAVPAGIEAAQAGEIEAGHCGLIDRATASRMATAQIARDQFMARMVEAHGARGAVLLAGNGHVRSDIGVQRWLEPPTRRRSQGIGLLEGSDDSNARFDRVVVTPRQPRDDPCAAMRRAPAASAPA